MTARKRKSKGKGDKRGDAGSRQEKKADPVEDVVQSNRDWAKWALPNLPLVMAMALAAFMICNVLIAWLPGVLPRRFGGRSSTPLLELIALKSFDWETSTTSAPISTSSDYAKSMLAVPLGELPEALRAALLEAEGGMEDGEERMAVGMAAARSVVNGQIVAGVRELCNSTRGCNVNEESDFGITPLHLAELYDAQELVRYLVDQGADVDAVDNVGRKPANLTYSRFVKNSQKWAEARGSDCQIPEVVIPAPGTALKEGERGNTKWALGEVKRLVSEGEPVMVRNVLPWLEAQGMQVRWNNASAFVDKWGDNRVKVAAVPYAHKFGASEQKMALREFFLGFMRGESTEDEVAEEGEIATATAEKEKKAAGKGVLGIANKFKGMVGIGKLAVEEEEQPPPMYVFQADNLEGTCKEGFELMNTFAQASLPLAATDSVPAILCDPSGPTQRLRTMHYYMGDAGTGAPFHIHSDAANLMLEGVKTWYVVPPRSAAFSKEPISAWRQRAGKEEGDMLRCQQRAGDLVYVPFDWGHAAINERDRTFGYTMELTNQRDTLMSVMGKSC
ncbi:unnamed protein product [Chrysoparadoxa australica]